MERFSQEGTHRESWRRENNSRPAGFSQVASPVRWPLHRALCLPVTAPPSSLRSRVEGAWLPLAPEHYTVYLIPLHPCPSSQFQCTTHFLMGPELMCRPKAFESSLNKVKPCSQFWCDPIFLTAWYQFCQRRITLQHFRTFLKINFKDFIYLSLDRWEGREKERERNINLWKDNSISCLSQAPYWGPSPETQACAWLGIEWGNLLVRGPVLNPLRHTPQNYFRTFEVKLIAVAGVLIRLLACLFVCLLESTKYRL